MKRYILFAFATISMMLCASCQKPIVNDNNGFGYLSLESMSLGIDESVITKAPQAAAGTYLIMIQDAEGRVVHETHYSDVVTDGKISLKAGSYTFIARSTDEEIPAAVFNNDIYGVRKDFTIAAGEETKLGELVCTLQQCKVTVSYSDDFLAAVTGNGSTTVTVTEGNPLVYDLTYTPASGSDKAKCTYVQDPGYFAVNEGSTMTVVFSGNVEGKSQKMTKTFTGIKVQQWHQIKFVQKKDEQGNATFDIVISDLISDAVLNSVAKAEEAVIGTDPDKPKGDGGITLILDHEAGCDAQITDLSNIEIVPKAERAMTIKLKASVPGGVKKFIVDITSTNPTFAAAVAEVGATRLNLLEPTDEQKAIFEIVPFPNGAELSGRTEIPFDLSPAQEPISAFKGTHTFVMTITDLKFCSKSIVVNMIVK